MCDTTEPCAKLKQEKQDRGGKVRTTSDVIAVNLVSARLQLEQAEQTRKESSYSNKLPAPSGVSSG